MFLIPKTECYQAFSQNKQFYLLALDNYESNDFPSAMTHQRRPSKHLVGDKLKRELLKAI